MEFALSEDQLALRALAARFTDREISPLAPKWDAEESTPVDVLRAAADLGLGTLTLPESLGGGGRPLIDAVIATEELAYGCAGFTSSFTLNELPAKAILVGGNTAQHERYIKRICEGAFAAYGMTEPGAGSDVAGISTRATRDGSVYRIQGSKVWITNSPMAEFFVIFAKTSPQLGRHGITAFIVERDTPGLEVGPKLPKLGQRAAPAAEVFLENVVVPIENRLGEEGEGHSIAMSVFDHTRPVIAAIAIGLMRRCLDESMRYASSRKTMDTELSRHQAIAFKLADMGMSIESARLLTYQAAWLADNGQSNSLHAAYAKLSAADASVRVASETVQIFGGMGYSREFAAEKFYRDAKLFQIYEGTSEIQKLIIARELAHRASG
ncbi:MAG TPA: acyl-CoA dehydrogenase family protein [Marmoricola sp.]|nr:acyl-CoA dehydrogenase family protein [Marmoricola sp.]